MTGKTTSAQRDRERAVLAAVERFAPLRRLGWAFLLAWVFCVFYTNAVSGYTGAKASTLAVGAGWDLFFTGLPVSMSVVMLVLIVVLEKRLGSPAQHAALFWIAPLATAVSTPLLFCELPDFGATAALFVIGAVLTGFGSGFMWVMWGEYYAKVTQEEVEFLAPSSAVAAAVLVLVVSAMQGWMALVVVTAFPLMSGLCLLLSWRDAQGRDATAEYRGAAEQRAFAEAHDSARKGLPRVLKSMGLSLIHICGSVRRHRAGRREVPAQRNVAAPAGRAGRGAAGARLPALREVPRGVPEACHRSCSS